MTDKVVILVTVASQEEGRRIARHLLDAKLAACVNLIHPIESVYRWEGKVAVDEECQLFIKTTRALFAEIRSAILKLHSYQTPEVICLPIVEGSEEYLRWLSDSVKPAGPAS